MNLKTLLQLILCTALLLGCATTLLREPKISRNGDVGSYRFVVLPNTSKLSSGSGGVYGNQYGVYGSSSSKEIDPANVIEGILLKKGLISIDPVKPEHEDTTLLVKYGESGRRTVVLGYALEVTIMMLSASNHEVIYSCTAEGIGSTEVDDIRQAIHRCLSGI